MPYTIKTKDGITVEGIPDGIPSDDPRLKSQVAQLRAAGQKSAAFTEPPPMPAGARAGGMEGVAQSYEAKPAEEPQAGLAGQFAREMGQNIGVAARGAIQGLAAPVTMLADPVTELINSVLPAEYKQLPPSQGLAAILTRLGVPEPETEAQRILQATTAGLAGAGGQVAAGQAIASSAPALAPSVAGGVGRTLASQPVQQMLGGAGAGAAAQGAAEVGAGTLGQLGAGLVGGAFGSGIGGAITDGVRLVGGRPAGVAPELSAAAEQSGVRLMATDLPGQEPKTFAAKWLRGLGEKIPVVGTGGLRSAQQTERVEAVRDIARQFGADDVAAASDDVMRDLLGKRAADLSKWTQAKNEVIDSLSIPAEGPAALPGAPRMIGATPGQTPSKIVPMTATTQKIDDSIAFLNGLKTEQVRPVIGILEDWKQAIQGQDLRNIELLRKQVGEAFKAPELASVRSTGERVLSDIYGAVKDDMTSYIKATGGDAALNKWQVDNKELSKMMGELKLPALKSIIERGESTPEAVRSMLFSKKRSDVEALYRNLSPTGQASARSAVLAQAVEKAGGLEQISLDRFANEVKRLGTQVGVVFSGDDLKQVQGLTRVLDATKRAGQAAVMPPTGVQAVLPVAATATAALIPGGPLERLVGTVLTGAAVGGAARVYESKAVRDILAKLPTVKVGGPEEAALFKRLAEAVQAVQGTEKE